MWNASYLVKSYTEIDASGRFYNPEHGYVDLDTPSPFRVAHDQDYPCFGQMVLGGADGTSARLTALSVTDCLVEADTDGNGDYDDEESIPWADLKQ